MKINAPTLLLLSLLPFTAAACDKGYVIGEGGEPEPDPCAGIDDDWPGEQTAIACKVLSCTMGGEHDTVTCQAALYIPEGHSGDVSIVALPSYSGGARDWNSYPYNKSAGSWQDLHYSGEGRVCGQISLDAWPIQVDTQSGERSFTFECTNWTASQFTWTTVRITADGDVLVEP